MIQTVKLFTESYNRILEHTTKIAERKFPDIENELCAVLVNHNSQDSVFTAEVAEIFEGREVARRGISIPADEFYKDISEIDPKTIVEW